MLAGPIFSREALTTPRQFRHYLVRSGYVAALFLLMYTTGQVAFGWQQTRSLGDLARFGSLVFQVFSLVQLSLGLFFALLFVANNISQEKDRSTLILLLMTDMSDRELVSGKVAASLLNVMVLLAISLPVFVFVHLLGGITLQQIGWSIALCASSAVAAGSWGALVAFWREKTFQTLAIGVLGLVLFLGTVEVAVRLLGVETTAGSALALLNPYRSLLTILTPLAHHQELDPVSVSALGSVLTMLGLSVVLNVIAVLRLRVWNPNRHVFVQTEEQAAASAAQTGKFRQVWSNVVLWREIRTRAYGRKIFVIKLAYLLLAVTACLSVADVVNAGSVAGTQRILGMLTPPGFALLALLILSLMLINAQAVTSITNERDTRTLELLLCTDITAKEFVFGKLLGSLYNTKELILVPMAMTVWFAVQGLVTLEHFTYLIVSLATLIVFAASLGLHSAMSFDRSRSAIGNSLGTIFFLFVGIFIFMILLVEASSSFYLQFQSFVVFIGVGSIALYASLRHKIPSGALTISAGVLPFFTFYAITSYLLGGSLGVCMTILLAYGFPAFAMLVPAISEFDMALGRTSIGERGH